MHILFFPWLKSLHFFQSSVELSPCMQVPYFVGQDVGVSLYNSVCVCVCNSKCKCRMYVRRGRDALVVPLEIMCPRMARMERKLKDVLWLLLPRYSGLYLTAHCALTSLGITDET